MPKIAVGQETNAGIEIYDEHHGTGQPSSLPTATRSTATPCEKQERVLLEAGYRVISYDRRGVRASGHPVIGYDYGPSPPTSRRWSTTWA